MNEQKFDINKLRVASPCSVGWEEMTGDERVRHCNSCQLNIYNIAEMTKPEVKNLISDHEGRLCIRLYKRADGTVLTKDCPVGFRVYQKRIARFAGATLAAILGLFSVSFGQKDQEIKVDASKVKIVRTENNTQESVLYGKITDTAGGIIPDAKIKLIKINEKLSKKTRSDDEGNYIYSKISKGIYRLEVKFDNFKTFIVENITIENNEKINVDILMEPADVTVTVGIYAETPSLIETTPSDITTTITPRKIEKPPH